MKSINDSVHGHIILNPIQEELLEQPELQRLAWIRQLGLTKLVYPGANNTRLEHALGASHLAGLVSEHLLLSEDEKNLLQAAGMLHDIGHTPFSHVLENLLKVDHMQYTADLITGKEVMGFEGGGKIPEILKKYGLDPQDVADLINRKYKKKKYLQSIIFGDIDVDQMDYLARDSHYSGAAYGILDIDRTIRTMKIVDDELCFLEKGATSIEAMVIARDHMFSSVYVHHTARIVDMMLLRAAESAIDKIPEFYKYTDDQLIYELERANEYAKDIAERIIFRRLFKRAYIVKALGAGKKELEKIKLLLKDGEKALEKKLCEKTGVKEGYIIVDSALKALEESEPRMFQVEAKIFRDSGEVVPINKVSSLTKALTKKKVGGHLLFGVYSLEEDTEKVAKAVEELLA